MKSGTYQAPPVRRVHIPKGGSTTETRPLGERFGYAVKVRREEVGLTQEDLAERAGIHRTYLSDVERGSRNVSLVNVERLARALELKIWEVFRRMDE